MHGYRNIFQIKTSKQFEEQTLSVFQYQSQNNGVYKEYIDFLGTDVSKIKKIEQIPFLPVEFFKSRKVICGNEDFEVMFTSSGTTGMDFSRHFVKNTELYKESFRRGFELFYGRISDFCILALLPSYLERTGSSLVYMTEDLIRESRNSDSGFYLYDFEKLYEKLLILEKLKQKILLLGVSFALQDFFEKYPMNLKSTIIMETGGMKGRKKETVRSELHDFLKSAAGVSSVHSEYGMTELLSQAYSCGNGRFFCPPWMRVFVRDAYDPFDFVLPGKSGGLNVVDLANFNSCSFIETKDLAVTNDDGSFEILGRFDSSDIRGCNLLAV
jgi:phenylacetate-coenzyme A ligase PaaK-like adenylate-forming protein